MANLVAMLRLPPNMKSTQWQVLAGPVLILLILSMMVLPLPAFVLDLLFTFNIALSIMVLLVAMFTQRTLEFAAFPTILLFTTLLRLSLNVASTRIILMDGHTGAAAAGRVVEAFGHFLVGGNFAIGIVVFIILVIINFMVITKGAGVLRKLARALCSMGCRVNRWRSTPISTPALLVKMKPRSVAPMLRRKRTSTARWTVRVSSCAAMPSPGS
ncbi:Flagellar biosynthesis protein flhA [Yokenella regensburgei]|nr:Flagellar biosynthesis protein flhA [Yokenella regensburgei]